VGSARSQASVDSGCRAEERSKLGFSHDRRMVIGDVREEGWCPNWTKDSICRAMNGAGPCTTV